MRGRRYALLVLVFVLVLAFLVGCSQGRQSTGAGTSEGIGGCPPQNGIVIVGTQGCPHCRALKLASQKVFGAENVCFVEVSPSYGGDQRSMKLFMDFYSIAYPQVPDSQRGVPIAALFYDGEVKAVFVGEMSEQNLRTVLDYVSKHGDPIIAHGSSFYKMDQSVAQKLTELFQNYFKGTSEGEDKGK